MTFPHRPVLLVLLALTACGGSRDEQPDFQVNGAAVYVRTDAVFTQRSDFQERIESTLEAALAYWGGSWTDLAGRSISLEGSRFVECHGVASATGCFDGNIRISTNDLGRPFSCIEETELVHEVGHAVLGDAAHRDARWMDFASVAQALSGRAGYTGAGEAGCPVIENVWQHPPER